MDIEGKTAQKMYLGAYKTYFTGKNRIVLPKKFRKELGNEGKFYIFLGYEGEIWGFNIEEWQKEAENRLKISLSDEKGRVQRRKFFSRADECYLDSQGRFILPREFIEQTEITNDILIVGAGDHFEIWNPILWQKTMKKN